MAIHTSSSAPSSLANNGVLAAKNVDDGCYIQVPLLHGYDPINKSEEYCSSQSDYDEDQKGTSLVRTCFNGLNALSGVGILSIPYALSQGGWLSLVLLLLVALICCYTGLLLQRCMSVAPDIRTYPDIGEHAFGFKGRFAVSLFMYLELYLVAVEFLILEGDNMDKLFPGKSFDLGTVHVQGKVFFTVVAALVILPTTWLRNMRALSLVSAGGVIASLVVVVSVLWVGVFDDVGFHQRGAALNLSGLPTALGLYSFCYCGHAVFPTLYSSMDKKSHFSKVLFICFIFCTLNYGYMAVIGYLMYGEDLQSQITLNLPRGKIASYVAIGTTLINPFTKFALTVTPVATALEDRFMLGSSKSGSYLTRTMIVLSTLVVAVSVPFFGYVMALIGSCLSVIVSVFLPCLCYLKIFEGTRKPAAEKAAIVLIVVAGILVAVVGTYTSMSQIVHSL